jgi:hypothetical protein
MKSANSIGNFQTEILKEPGGNTLDTREAEQATEQLEVMAAKTAGTTVGS